MRDNRTESMLARVPKILAVTAASYGIDLQARNGRATSNEHRHRRQRKREAQAAKR